MRRDAAGGLPAKSSCASRGNVMMSFASIQLFSHTSLSSSEGSRKHLSQGCSFRLVAAGPHPRQLRGPCLHGVHAEGQLLRPQPVLSRRRLVRGGASAGSGLEGPSGGMPEKFVIVEQPVGIWEIDHQGDGCRTRQAVAAGWSVQTGERLVQPTTGTDLLKAARA